MLQIISNKCCFFFSVHHRILKNYTDDWRQGSWMFSFAITPVPRLLNRSVCLGVFVPFSSISCLSISKSMVRSSTLLLERQPPVALTQPALQPFPYQCGHLNGICCICHLFHVVLFSFKSIISFLHNRISATFVIHTLTLIMIYSCAVTWYLLGLLELFLQLILLFLHLTLPLLQLLQLNLVLLKLLQLCLVFCPLHLQRLQLLLQVLHLGTQWLLFLQESECMRAECRHCKRPFTFTWISEKSHAVVFVAQ